MFFLVLVAQRIEQRFPKPLVGGSIPLKDTTNKQAMLVFLFKRKDCYLSRKVVQ